MRCPRCDLEVAEDRAECPRCGVVFRKIGRHSVPAPNRLEARVVQPGPPAASPPPDPFVRVRLSTRERLTLMEALARGLRSGLPMLELLRVLEAPAARTGRVVRALAREIEGGATLAEAWPRAVRNPGVAAPLLLAMSEETGDLEGACVAVGRLDAELLRLRRALTGPLVRPFLSVLAACFLLPIPTAVLGSAAAYLLEVGLSLGLVAALVLAVLGALRAVAESPRWSQRLLGAPFGRDVDRWLVATVLEATTRAGTPPGRVFSRLREASVEPARRARFEAARGLLEQGGGFTEAIALLGLFDATARLEIRAGEESGTLEEVFRGVARDAGDQMVSRLRLASTVVTFVVSLLILGALALRILAGFKAALGGTEDVLQQLEAETPIRLLEGLKQP